MFFLLNYFDIVLIRNIVVRHHPSIYNIYLCSIDILYILKYNLFFIFFSQLQFSLDISITPTYSALTPNCFC